MSRLIDGLVERRLMTRRPGRGDRRRIHLRLTPRGVGLLAAAHRATQEGLAGTLERLTPQERRLVGIALRCLRRPFLPAAPARRP
jgi:DNA-binding MarR family transcriptional regulator